MQPSLAISLDEKSEKKTREKEFLDFIKNKSEEKGPNINWIIT